MTGYKSLFQTHDFLSLISVKAWIILEYADIWELHKTELDADLAIYNISAHQKFDSIALDRPIAG